MNNSAKFLVCFFALILPAGFTGTALKAQSIRDGGEPEPKNEAELPLKRLTLFSSGVGFFEHSGTVRDSVFLTLPFELDAVNDALKSLVINDPGSPFPLVRYPSEQTLTRTLKSLSVDLSENPGTAELLNSLKGAELEVYTPAPVRGRIIGVEYRDLSANRFSEGPNFPEPSREAYLSLLGSEGIRIIGLKDIGSFSFKDPRLNADLNRALDLITGFRDSRTRNLNVELSGAGNRNISLSYVISAPVWKVSYRLDLSRNGGPGISPFLQGWVIVDNDGDTDWKGVELSLVTGRPVSFIQNLYAPYRLARPVLPLAIAGTAEARTYDSGWKEQDVQEETNRKLSRQGSMDMAARFSMEESAAPDKAHALGAALMEGAVETALGEALGDQFAFTLKRPVYLDRRQSAMLPLVEGAVKAEKTLVFSGRRAQRGGSIHPAVSAELTNTTGMKLPPGPITVYDGGVYAGDALIEFFPPGEKRLISYGEDLSVSGTLTASNSRTISAVTVNQGIMIIARKQTYEKTYAFKNASGEPKKLVLEHPITGGSVLSEGISYDERTDNVYRFIRTLPPDRELTLTVREEIPAAERIVLAQLRLESFVSYASDREIPETARALLQKAMEYRRKVEEAKAALTEKEERRTRLIAEQDRIRRNLEAAGSGTPQGQEYLKRLMTMDGDIDALGAETDKARKAAQEAQNEYDAYLGSISLN
jgi:hypothetical protein